MDNVSEVKQSPYHKPVAVMGNLAWIGLAAFAGHRILTGRGSAIFNASLLAGSAATAGVTCLALRALPTQPAEQYEVSSSADFGSETDLRPETTSSEESDEGDGVDGEGQDGQEAQVHGGAPADELPDTASGASSTTGSFASAVSWNTVSSDSSADGPVQFISAPASPSGPRREAKDADRKRLEENIDDANGRTAASQRRRANALPGSPQSDRVLSHGARSE